MKWFSWFFFLLLVIVLILFMWLLLIIGIANISHLVMLCPTYCTCICSVLLYVCNNRNDEYTRQRNCIQIQALVQDINFIQSSIILKSVISCRVVCKQIFNHVKLEGGKSMNWRMQSTKSLVARLRVFLKGSYM